MVIKKVKVSELKHYTNNPRKMSNEIYRQLVNSIKKFGDAEVLVINSKNEVIGGNHRLDAFIELFGEEYEADCKVVDLPKDEEVKLNIALNGISGEFKIEMLKDILIELNERGEDLSYIGFEKDELNVLTEGLIRNPEEKAFTLTEPKYQVKKGQIYQLGRHRLMCGDATSEDLYKLLSNDKVDLVFTDPPYNIGFDYNKHEDKMSETDYTEFCTKWFNNLKKVCKSNIITPGPRNIGIWYKIEEPTDIGTWVKKNTRSGGTAFFLRTSEPILFYGKFKKRNTDLFEFNMSINEELREIEKTVKSHAPAKPLKFVKDVIESYSNVLENVLDIFGGSGTTLIACEQSDRNCFMLELDEKYCSNIIERWERLTNQTANLIKEEGLK